MANAQLILLSNSPSTLVIPSVFDMQILGNTSGKTINVELGGKVSGVDGGTTVNLNGLSSNNVSLQRDGTTLNVVDQQGDVVASIAASTSSQSNIQFTEGTFTLEVTQDQNIKLGNVELGEGETANGSSLEGQGGQGSTINLDNIGSITTQGSLQDDLSTGAFTLNDTVANPNNVLVNGFGADDSIVLTGVSASDVSIQVSAGNTQIEFSDGQGGLSRIELVGVTGFFDSVSAFNNSTEYGDITFA